MQNVWGLQIFFDALKNMKYINKEDYIPCSSDAYLTVWETGCIVLSCGYDNGWKGIGLGYITCMHHVTFIAGMGEQWEELTHLHWTCWI